jgi:hypothetical protein
VTENVSLVDVFPTLDQWPDAAGDSRAPVAVAGSSLLPLLEGRSLGARALFALRRTENVVPTQVRSAVILGNDKYIRSEPQGTDELFDTARDPLDKSNLASSRPERVAELRAMLEAFERRTPARARSFVDSQQSAAELSEQLQALGYVE